MRPVLLELQDGLLSTSSCPHSLCSSIMQIQSPKNESADIQAEQLLRLAHDGDREALGALLDLYRRYMSRLARNRIGPRLHVKADTSDLAQDVCLEAHRHFGQFQGTTEAEFGRLASQDSRRSRRQFRASIPGDEKRDMRRERPMAIHSIDSSLVFAIETVARDGTPSEIAVNRETSIQLATAMDQLAPHYRQVIDLRNGQGLSFAEVADQMGRSTASVEKLWWRAVAKLRSLIRRAN